MVDFVLNGNLETARNSIRAAAEVQVQGRDPVFKTASIDSASLLPEEE